LQPAFGLGPEVAFPSSAYHCSTPVLYSQLLTDGVYLSFIHYKTPATMKIYFTMIFCFVSLICFSQTQSEMNEGASKDFKQADKELNDVYNKILTEYKEDTAFIKNLKIAQKLWIQFRDAEMKAKYPDKEPGYYGSTQPLCWDSYLTELTTERINKLKTWLTGIEEGDVCAGSVKMKE